MSELTQRDREKLAQAPIGRLALKRIEDLEFELEKSNALIRLHRERPTANPYDLSDRNHPARGQVRR